MLSDIEIAQQATIRPAAEVARALGVRDDEYEPYGPYLGKVHPRILERLADRPRGKYVVVTGITPTPLGEGKTVTTIGASMALARLGHSVCTCIRQPSLGPTFGIKGGAAGGGHSQVLPMEDLNLHLTGDFHAVGLANNLACAFVDNHLYHGNPFAIDPYAPTLRRVIDLNDRWGLEEIVTGLGSGVVRRTGFDITAASEVMAILGLAADFADLRARLGRMVVAYRRGGEPVTCDDLQVAGAMAALLKEALKPNLVQTIEHTPCFVHTGPFANIAHGNSSILADLIATKLVDFTVTEAGFGAAIGMEKFFDIKCRASGLRPDCVLLVATVRALKVHSGRFEVKAGKPLDPVLLEPDPGAVAEGCGNLAKQIENVRRHGLPCVVALNRFASDAEAEYEVAIRAALDAGAAWAGTSSVYAEGGDGGLEVARAVAEACETPGDFRFLYDLEASIPEKIETIAREMYGAGGVAYEKDALRAIDRYTALGYDRMPVCMAKTHLSLSHDPMVKGRPEGFTLPVRDVRASVGAGFLYPLCGQMRTIPGLPTRPGGERIDLTPDGRVTGLF